MRAEIQLPEFPAMSYFLENSTFDMQRDAIRAYARDFARAAVEADRKGRVAKSQDDLDRLNPYTHAKGSKAVWESGYRTAERNNGIRPAGGEQE